MNTESVGLMNPSTEAGPGPKPAGGTPPRDVADPGPWKRLKRGGLRSLQAGLEFSGLASLYVRLRRVTGATILMFHSVAAPDHARWIDPRYRMAPNDFERRLRFLARRRRPVSLARLVQALEEGRDLPPRSVVVTFDDGYLDNLAVAAPLLAKYGVPATFFLPTGIVSRAEIQWVDRLFNAFQRRTRHVLNVNGRRFDLECGDEERTARRELERVLLTSTHAERNAHLQSVDDQLAPEGDAPRLTMDWKDVKNLQKLSPDFEIGGHSRDHLDLSSMNGEASAREIEACAQDLSRELGAAPRHFSFPYERWTARAKDEVRRQGFRSACGMGSDYLVTSKSDPFAMPRLDPQTLRSAFKFATSGAFPGLSRAVTGRA